MGYPLSYLYLLCFVAMVVLATLVAAVGPAYPLRRWITVLMALVGAWALADFLSNLGTEAAQLRWVSRVSAPVWALVPFLILHTAATYAGLSRRAWARAAPLLILPALGAVALEWSGLLHTSFDVAAVNGGYFVSHATPWQHAVNLYFVAYLIAAALVDRGPGRPVTAATERHQVARFIWRWALPAAALGGLTNGGLALVGVEPPYLGAVLASAVAAGMAVGVLRRTFLAPLAEVRSLKAQVEHAQKLESLGVLAGGIAHDFNNLLGGVLGNAGLVLNDLPADSPQRERVERIVLAARRAAVLTGAMLSYAGQAKAMVEKVSFNRLVVELGRLLEVSLPKGTRLRLELEPELPEVCADPAQLQQVVMNLITNAAEAVGERRGCIVVQTGRCQLAPRAACDAGSGEELPPGAYVYVRVSDNGVGMDEALRARIFDPFFSTKFAGRGLGLAVVHGIVRGHGGAITVDSQPGRGSCFTVYLRPAAAHAGSAPGAPGPEPGRLSAWGCVLVVDDDEAIREVAAEVLVRAGYRVHVAEDGDLGVEVVAARHAELSAVLLDLTMPRLGGQAALRRIRELAPRLPVVLTTGYNAEQVAAGLPDDPHVGYLQKPYSPEDLLRALGSQGADQRSADRT